MDLRPVYYVYALFDEFAIPRWIGKGTGERINNTVKLPPRSSKATRKYVNRQKCTFIRRTIKAIGYVPRIKLADNLPETKAFDLEILLIKTIGRSPEGPLLNWTDGGEGSSGCKHTRKTRKLLAEISRKSAAEKQVGEHSNLMLAVYTSLGSNWRSERSRKSNATQSPRKRSLRAKKGANTLGPIGCSERARKANAALTPEERSERVRKIHQNMSPSQKKSRNKKIARSMTPDEQSVKSRNYWDNLTPKERLIINRGYSERAKKIWERRKAANTTATISKAISPNDANALEKRNPSPKRYRPSFDPQLHN